MPPVCAQLTRICSWIRCSERRLLELAETQPTPGSSRPPEGWNLASVGELRRNSLEPPDAEVEVLNQVAKKLRGSWYTASIAVLSLSYREFFQPSVSAPYLGFRVVARPLP
jgi:hypothetical protein